MKYRTFSLGREWSWALKILHGFTNDVILKRKEEYNSSSGNIVDDVDDVGRKKRVAFLDLLIRESKAGVVDNNMVPGAATQGGGKGATAPPPEHGSL